MATIKSYTDISQSRKLAEILPLESADMCWTNHCYGNIRSSITISAKPIDEYKNLLKRFADLTEIDVFYPAWSLTALLSILPRIDIEKEICSDNTFDYRVKVYVGDGYIGDWFDNPVDACVTMIENLHELKIL